MKTHKTEQPLQFLFISKSTQCSQGSSYLSLSLQTLYEKHAAHRNKLRRFRQYDVESFTPYRVLKRFWNPKSLHTWLGDPTPGL